MREGGGGEEGNGMGGKEKEGRVGGRGKGGEGKGERMWRGPEISLPRGPCWLSAGLTGILHLESSIGI